MSKVLWERIPNVGSKARECAKAMSLAFVLLDFQHAGVRRRAQCTRRSVDMSQQPASFAGLSVARVLTFYGPRSEFCLSKA